MSLSPNLPLEYRQRETTQIMQAISAGDSCSVVGASGSAKSNLYRHLLSPAVRRHYLGDDWQKLLFVGIDAHALTEVSENAAFSELLQGLIEEARQCRLAAATLNTLADLNTEAAAAVDAAARHRLFRRGVRAVLGPDRAIHMVILFDQLEKVYGRLDAQFLTNLRAIRDEFKYQVSYVTFTRDLVNALRCDDDHREFYELLRPHEIGLKGYDENDARTLLQRVAGRNRYTLGSALGERLIGLTGGHPGILRACLMVVIKRAEPLSDNDQQATWQLLLDKNVEEECKELWDSLRADERLAVWDIVHQISGGRETDLQQRLELKGLVGLDQLREDGKEHLAYPIFGDYVRARPNPRGPAVTIYAGPITIEDAQVTVNGEKLSPLRPSELRLLTVLAERQGQVCSRDELSYILCAEEGKVLSDDALNKLVERLRAAFVAGKQDPGLIKSVHGRGYMLSID